MAKVVYIFSLGHSGSTLLDLMLSGHPGICGLGEVYMMTEPAQRIRRLADTESKLCSCGRSVSKCELWGPVVAGIAAHPETDHVSALRNVLNSARTLDGVQWLSDSSKNTSGLRALQMLVPSGEVSQLRVIHLVRDVRSFAASHLARRGHRGIISALRAMRMWKKSLDENVRALQGANCAVMNIGYEELCLFPRATLSSVCRFLDISWTDDMLRPCPGGAHIATGNPMRLDQAKSSETTYDHRWFFRPDVAAAYLLYPGIRRINHNHSYPLTRDSAQELSFRPPAIEQG